MRKYVIAVTVCGLFSLALGAWEPVGPNGGYMRSVVISHTDENIAYAATYTSPSQIVKSTDGGSSWSKVGSYSGYNYCMAIDPSNHNRLFCGYYYYVWRSTNGGVTWTSSALPSTYIYDLKVHPTNSLYVYGAGRQYINSVYEMVFFMSTDGGSSWTTTQLVPDTTGYGWSVAIDPSNPSVIYVGGAIYTGTAYNPRIYKSTDGGSTFTESYTATSGYYVYSLAVHPTNSNIVYAGTYMDGIYRSTNGGTSWLKMSTYNYNFRMVTSSANPDVVFSSGYSAVYRSTNAGATWTTYSSGLTGTYFYGLATSQSNPSNVLLCNQSGCFKSTNMAVSWVEANAGIALAAIIAIGVAPSSPSTMYVTFEDVAVFKTTNNGSDWTKLPQFSSCGDMCAFGVYNTDPNTVLALEGYG